MKITFGVKATTVNGFKVLSKSYRDERESLAAAMKARLAKTSPKFAHLITEQS